MGDGAHLDGVADPDRGAGPEGATSAIVTAAATPARRPRRWLRYALAVCVIGAIAAPKLLPVVEPFLTAFGDDPSARAAEGPGGGESGRPLTVDAVTLVPVTIAETVTTTGTLLAQEQVDLQAEVSGRITAINFREGSRVGRGDLLVKLTDADLVAERSAVERELELARQRERRGADLLGQGYLNQEDYDVVASARDVLESRLALIEAQIGRTEIRAPFDGVAGLRYVSEGAVVGPTTRIATLQSTDRLKIEFAVAEKYADRIGTGDRVAFSVAGSTGQHEAIVYARDPAIDAATRTLSVRAICDNADGRLLPGAFANVTITVGRRDDALMIPAAALVPDIGGAYVLVGVDGIAERRTVEVGIRTEAEVEIVSGLVPGDVVITSGLLQIEPGRAVAVMLPEPPRPDTDGAADRRSGS